MASQLTQLKQQIAQLAKQTADIASGLQEFEQRFKQQVEGVQAIIGGSASNKDREVIDSLEVASRQVRSACDALSAAGRVATEYAQSL